MVLIVGPVHVGPCLEQELEHVAPLGFDRDVQRLRAAAPERMRANHVDHLRRSRKDAADFVDLTSAHQLEEPLNDLVSRQRGHVRSR